MPAVGTFDQLLVAASALAGCNAVDADKSLFADPRAKAGPMQESSAASVEFHPTGGKPLAVKVAIEGDSLHAQQALDKSAAWNKYGRMNVELARKTPQGRWTKMAVSCDRNARKVEPQCDYQIQPGDVLIVKEDPTTIVDDMLDRVGPLRKMLNR
jgi:hypothetical protein